MLLFLIFLAKWIYNVDPNFTGLSQINISKIQDSLKLTGVWIRTQNDTTQSWHDTTRFSLYYVNLEMGKGVELEPRESAESKVRIGSYGLSSGDLNSLLPMFRGKKVSIWAFFPFVQMLLHTTLFPFFSLLWAFSLLC